MFNQNLKNNEIYPSNDNSFKKIIYAYKKLKQIAKHESSANNDLANKVANLSPEQLEKINLLESRMGCRLVAYENSNLNYRKDEILDGLHLLLDEYLSLYSNKTELVKTTEPVKKAEPIKKTNKVIQLKKELPESVNEEFNGFF